MSLQTRINAIERQAGVSVGCPECGYYKGALVKFKIVTEPEESARLEDRGANICSFHPQHFCNIFATFL